MGTITYLLTYSLFYKLNNTVNTSTELELRIKLKDVEINNIIKPCSRLSTACG